jgi:hypothetical protein
MTTFARIVLAASLAVVLAGCTPQPTPNVTGPSEPTASPPVEPQLPASIIPSSCDLPAMVELIDGLGFPGAIDVTPAWEPAEGTDLKLALDNGGIACAWGPPNTDAGVIVYWVSVTDELWTEASGLWESSGLESVDVPGLTEDAAYFVYAPQSEDNEFPHWEVNLRFTDLWIKVATSSWENPSDGNAIVEAAREIALP